ncbi:TauD/TfdA family dioxygenase [Tenacibaculum sp. M341]|uniref:TauD/TfdA family dioxygenase n=1 Tax=Tenacibaculum sp. M341 TaxID=2530339 RepID=UPI00104BB989|nr:TauD/TfdA family dioxygenase [Tenacibaculum sp. M341]TCI93198.1 hypothetical protein EYW44_06165 [Tenacibaculum sp. M341]
MNNVEEYIDYQDLLKNSNIPKFLEKKLAKDHFLIIKSFPLELDVLKNFMKDFTKNKDVSELLLKRVKSYKIPSLDRNGYEILSSTYHKFLLHTDSYFLKKPHRIISLLCYKNSVEGGETLVAPLKDILDKTPSCLINKLQKISAFKNFNRPVLSFDSEERIYFNLREIKQQIEKKIFSLSEEELETLVEFDKVLERIALRVKLTPGDLIIFHNHKCLHGRNGFNKNSDRELVRCKIM